MTQTAVGSRDTRSEHTAHRRICRAPRPAWLLLIAIVATRVSAAEELEAPFGIEQRIPWTTSRLVGSPEPPLPYTVERTFTKVAWKKPVYAIEEPGSDCLLVVLAGTVPEQPSRIMRVRNNRDADDTTLVLEMPGRLVYSVCFDPGYAENRQLYVFSNGPTGQPERSNRVARYTVGRDAPWQIEPASEQLILEWRSAGHDGGDMAFGADGMFYVTTGDGSGDSDEWDSGQTLDDLLGAVLRLDMSRGQEDRPYAIPADNPFVDTPGARGEIWAYGLRNPWRMSVDAKTGDLWVGNNGQDRWETAHLVRRGENYGWSVFEGSHPFYLERKHGPTPHVPPTIEHSHAEFRSLTGGLVYYGDKLPELNGAYLYGDFSSGRIWGMKHDGRQVEWHRELADTTLQIAGFALDRHGDLLVVDHGGGLYRLVPAPPSEQSAPFPKNLSETGLFASTCTHQPLPALVPYTVNLPGWADGARAERFMALPDDARIEYDSGQSWTFPDGTALAQTLFLDRQEGNADSRFRVETRVLVRQQGEWAGYSYLWNDDQSDAVLVEREGRDIELAMHEPTSGSPRQQTWRVPSRGECMVCHSRAANFVLGLSEAQLNRDHDYPTARDNQLRAFEHIGLFKDPLPKPPSQWSKLPDWRDSSQDVEQRARAYLHVNCSMCHVVAGGGNSKMELAFAQPREKMNLIGARPQHDTFGIANAMLVAPGEVDRSVLVHRLNRRGRGQMPPLVTTLPDTDAVSLMREWIAQMKPPRPIVQRWQTHDLAEAVDEPSPTRSLESGKTSFRETGCIQCHRFGAEGGSVGPDLTKIGKRPAREVLESILEPSKIIADEYATFLIQTEGGDVVSGRIEREDEQVLVVRPTNAAEQSREIQKNEIAARKRLDASNMPAGIVDVLTKDEVLDLVDYLRNGAK